PRSHWAFRPNTSCPAKKSRTHQEPYTPARPSRSPGPGSAYRPPRPPPPRAGPGNLLTLKYFRPPLQEVGSLGTRRRMESGDPRRTPKAAGTTPRPPRPSPLFGRRISPPAGCRRRANMAAAPRFRFGPVVFAVASLAGVPARAQVAAEQVEPAWSDPLHTQDLARAKAAALRADPRELAQARRDAAQGWDAGRVKEFLAGRGTLDILLEASQSWLESDLALSERDADRVAARARHWQQAWLIEAVNRARYEAARIAVQDLMQPRYVRLEAELNLVQA